MNKLNKEETKKFMEEVKKDQELLKQIEGAGGELLLRTLSTNITSLLYLLAEQQLMTGKLLTCLLESGALLPHQVDSITKAVSDSEQVASNYRVLYENYTRYFVSFYYMSKENNLNEDEGDSKDDSHN